MPKIEVAAATLHYEIYGIAGKTPAVLLHGLGSQLTGWPETYVQALAQDRMVYAFDQRDGGLSSKFGPSLAPEYATDWDGARDYALTHEVPYTLFDMADDIVDAMASLKVGSYHVIGHSMGGMIAQIVAARDVEHVASLTSLASSSGQRDFSSIGKAKEGMKPFLTSFPTTEEAAKALAAYATAFSVGLDGVAEEDIQTEIVKGFERNYCPAGNLRQFWAIMASGDRSDLLSTISCPTLAVLGRHDISVPIEIGKRLVELVPNSRLEIIENMSHSLSDALAPRLAELTHQNFSRAEQPGS